MTTPILDIAGLNISFDRNRTRVVSDVSLRVAPGAFHAIVGESGSGKTMVARAVLGLLPPGGAVTSGRISLSGQDLAQLPAKELRKVRGGEVGLIFQDPLTSLNPALRIGRQLTEGLLLHRGVSGAEARDRAANMLCRVGISDARAALTRYPHEFSGGMRQRIMIASALLPGAKLIIADEPTTALDALVQAEVMALLRDITQEFQTAVLFISHDLGLVSDRADEVTVLDSGAVVDQGATELVLKNPRHPLTKALLEALPKGALRHTPKTTTPVLEISGLEVTFTGRRRWPWIAPPQTQAVRGVDLILHQGECLALVGASGSGKTTVGRAIMGLSPAAAGTILFEGRDITYADAATRRMLARRIQIVFQDPMSSLNPRLRLVDIVAEGLRYDPSLSVGQACQKAIAALGECGLDASFARRFPHQLSGGQRQRVGIARALVMEPEILVLDEPVSALDVTVQAQILRLLSDLKEQRGLSFLFISHDLGVIEEMADTIAVMAQGLIVEIGPAKDVLHAPSHDFTRRLLSILPELRKDGDGYSLVRREYAS